ncbi:hypothetical protein [Pseudomonas japonica]|uniref:Uncharacterized protein n=1 Tax=Pseudomonas japonica TaxID=256466 RepID=A0A239BQU3_9PSED|nr:hypothetical protein [Pseudomonas japonica]SNS09771.1 hypothetical protein SAMN05444352_103115 [Pseudomonas japonica]
MSAHILIDQQLEALSHPQTPPEFEATIQRQLVEMMKDGRITIDEFDHHCGRLNKTVSARQEAA